MGEALDDEDGIKFREAQTLAALSCWGPDYPLEGLSFEGDVQLSLPVAAAAEAAGPTDLSLAFHSPSQFNGRVHSDTVYAGMHMLLRLAPRLEGLWLLSVGHWAPMALKPLGTCTALQSLDLGLDGGDAWFAPDLQEAIRLAGSLTRLTDLAMNGGPGYHERTDSLRLDRLSALTALTRLSLSIPVLTQRPCSFDGVSRWEAHLWREERQQLSQALQSMAALEELWVEGMCLDVRELAALSRLQSLSLGGLLLPPAPGVRTGEEAALEGGRAGVQDQPAGAAEGGELLPAAAAQGPGAGAGAGPGPAGAVEVAPGADAAAAAGAPEPGAALRERWPLPPQLQELDLEGASPSLLVALALPQSLRNLNIFVNGGPHSRGWPTLHLNTLDVRLHPPPHGFARATYSLCPEAAAELGPALDVLTERSQEPITALCVRADVGRGEYIAPGGHCVWLEALARVRLKELSLHGVWLGAEADVAALARHFPQLTVLDLGGSLLELDRLTQLSALTRLQELTLCLGLRRGPMVPHGALDRGGEALLALVGALPDLRLLHGRNSSHDGAAVTASVFYRAGEQLHELRPQLELEVLGD